MESSDSSRSRSASATAAEPQDPQPQDAEPQYNEPQYNEPQYNEPQYNKPPAATSLDPRLTWPRPYVDRPAADPQNGPERLPRFTPREDAAAAAGPPGRSGRRQPVRAIIGDEIRVPFIWCEFGTCDATYTHPDALGERDLRARALAAGWRYDALGRRACPGCAQHDPTFWTARPPAPVPGNWRRAV